MSKSYILNIGHNTHNGDTLTPQTIENVARKFFRVEKHQIVTGEYDGKPEETSVLHCTTGATVAESMGMVRTISNELDQECVAVAFCDGVVAIGSIQGDNPKGYAFDWAQFRI